MTNYLVYTVKANFEFPGLLFLILKWVQPVLSVKCEFGKALYLQNKWFSLYESRYIGIYSLRAFKWYVTWSRKSIPSKVINHRVFSRKTFNQQYFQNY